MLVKLKQLSDLTDQEIIKKYKQLEEDLKHAQKFQLTEQYENLEITMAILDRELSRRYK